MPLVVDNILPETTQALATLPPLGAWNNTTDFGYRFAATRDLSAHMAEEARFYLEFDKDGKFSKACRLMLAAGFLRRHAESVEPVYLAKMKTEWAVVTKDRMQPGSSYVQLDVGLACGMEKKKFQALAKGDNADRDLHARCKALRDAASTYCSNRMGDLRKALNGSKRNRGGNNTLTARVTKFLDAILKSAKRGGDNADLTAAQVTAGTAAFWEAVDEA
jgi:hypothetical protein